MRPITVEIIGNTDIIGKKITEFKLKLTQEELPKYPIEVQKNIIRRVQEAYCTGRKVDED